MPNVAIAGSNCYHFGFLTPNIMNAIDFLKNKEILQEGFEKWIVKFTDGKEFNIVYQNGEIIKKNKNGKIEKVIISN